ncbi:hypothetical protein Cabys_3789 [Caldithrix abyssi DSM 13497]|uniref:DUF1573 domain-containing protein n=1 Tax=Caldithrix abyssi DSM 13497 TaxID=880073 RepID=A0A1J1CD96_CALAY|nr:hypothetical protein Cabys_3789 [Caldithrix abyssi DSM 13497]
MILGVVQISNLNAQDSTKVSGPVITASEKVFDFGQVPENAVVSHVFVLKNQGSDSLRIQRIKSG